MVLHFMEYTISIFTFYSLFHFNLIYGFTLLLVVLYKKLNPKNIINKQIKKFFNKF
jgi:hypothetical protein